MFRSVNLYTLFLCITKNSQLQLGSIGHLVLQCMSLTFALAYLVIYCALEFRVNLKDVLKTFSALLDIVDKHIQITRSLYLFNLLCYPPKISTVRN